MKQFLADYKNAQICKLGVNYRCSANIVKAAGNLIAHNQNRLPKDILAAHEAGAEVENLCYEKVLSKMKRYGSRFWSIVKGVLYRKWQYCFEPILRRAD